MGSDVHFACTGCGKCCDTPPTVSIQEGLALYRELILTIKMAGPIIDPRLPATHTAVVGYRIHRAHLQAHGAETFDLRIDAAHSFEATLQIYATGIRAGQDDPCPLMTDDGLCSIYETRPQRCRAVPFDYFLPEPACVANGAERLRAAVARDWKCDITDQAPIVAQDHAFTPGQARDAFTNGLALMDGQAPALAVVSGIFQQKLREDPALVARVATGLARGEAIDFSFLIVLDALHELRRRAEAGQGPDAEMFHALPSLADFLAAQLPLIDAAIARNIARRRPQDRANTERLRSLKGDYQKALTMV